MKQIDEALVKNIIEAIRADAVIAQLPDGAREYVRNYLRMATGDLAVQLGVNEQDAQMFVAALAGSAGTVTSASAAETVVRQVEKKLMARGAQWLAANWKTMLASSGSGAAVLEILKNLGVM